jgi:hypothetical protein
MEKLPKYHRDGDFEDPIVRCTECQAIVHRDYLTKNGACQVCGNRRVRNVLTLSGEEMQNLKDKNIDPDFLVLFEGSEDADGAA